MLTEARLIPVFIPSTLKLPSRSTAAVCDVPFPPTGLMYATAPTSGSPAEFITRPAIAPLGRSGGFAPPEEGCCAHDVDARRKHNATPVPPAMVRLISNPVLSIKGRLLSVSNRQ